MLKGRGFRPVVWLGLATLGFGLVALALFFSLSGMRVVAASPGDGAEDIAITAPIRLTFSQPMDTASVETCFQIEPDVEGHILWHEEELVFQPQPALAPGMTYTITLDAGAKSQSGRSLQEGGVWSFQTRHPQLLYLGRPQPSGELRQLFAAPLEGGEPRQLTDYAWGVWDYAVHPQGEAIVFSVLRGDGGSDLWRMERDGEGQDLLLACPEAACLNPAWSPDGRWLAYERRDIWAGAPNLDPKAGRIWLLDLEEGEERPLFDYDVALHSPVWAPDGRRLAYVSPLLPGLEVFDLDCGDLLQFGNEWGAAPIWSPDGQRLVMPELMLAGEEFVVRLVRVDLQGGELVDISGDDDFVKDVAPAWSPGGGWIAFGRQFLDEGRWTPGRQPWLTRPDASEAYSLLAEPMADQFAFAWRPDGAALAYLSTDLSEGLQAVPEVSVWVYDFASREPAFIATGGVLPGWLP